MDTNSEILKVLVELFEFVTGANSNGDNVITSVGQDGTFSGKAKFIILLGETTFKKFYVDDGDDCVAEKGYNIALPAGTMINPGKKKFITGFEYADGGIIQIWK
jgi:hypothetical protein